MRSAGCRFKSELAFTETDSQNMGTGMHEHGGFTRPGLGSGLSMRVCFLAEYGLE